MKALCADVDKVETWGRWRPLQRSGSAGGVGVQPPPQPPAAAGLFSASLHGVDGENKHEIIPENLRWVCWVQREAEGIALEIRENGG